MHWSNPHCNPVSQTTSGAGLRCITGEAISKWISVKGKTASDICCNSGHNHKRAMEMQDSSLKWIQWSLTFRWNGWHWWWDWWRLEGKPRLADRLFSAILHTLPISVLIRHVNRFLLSHLRVSALFFRGIRREINTPTRAWVKTRWVEKKWAADEFLK